MADDDSSETDDLFPNTLTGSLRSSMERLGRRFTEKPQPSSKPPYSPPKPNHDKQKEEKMKQIKQFREQTDLFVADVVDPCLRDDRDMMSIPFFSLEKRKRLKPIVYERDGVKVTVAGLSTVGIATIWDCDFLIWLASELNEAIERGETPTRRLRVTPYQFMVATGRMDPKHKGGRPYLRLKDTLRRLQGTVNEVSIPAGGKTYTGSWSWIDYWESIEDDQGRITGLEVIVSDWFYERVISDRAVLSIDPAYFRLTGGMERWLYRIARRHCGGNEQGWSFTAKTLHQKYPTGRAFRQFKSELKTLVGRDCLPEYHSTWEERDGRAWVHFRLRDGVLVNRRLPRPMRTGPE